MPKKYIIALWFLFAIAAIAFRLSPHPWNFSPIGALFIFSGFVLPKKWIWIPFAPLLITDIILGSYQWQVMAVVYASYFIMAQASSTIRAYNISNVFLTSVSSAVLFFITTNFAHWFWFGGYSLNLQGLSEAYIAAIPFFRNSLFGYLFYSVLFFSLFESARVFCKKFARMENLEKERPRI